MQNEPNTAAQPPANRMAIAKVQAYVEQKTGTQFSLQTIYNWINVGVSGEKLRVVLARGTSKYNGIFNSVRFTTEPWVDDFLARIAAKTATRH